MMKKCRVPMWMGGLPSGFCDAEAFGPQYPREYLASKDARYMFDRPPYCVGPCCPAHGGPKADEPIIFQDGYTDSGRPMWCAVMPGFQNLQENEAGFSGNPVEAVYNLRAALAEQQP
jgi:hypothetical protein